MTTASDGTYSLGGLPSDTVDLTVTPSDAGHVPNHVSVSTSGGATTTANVTLDPTGSMTATIDAADGTTPLSDVGVDVVGPSPGSSDTPLQTQPAVTDSDGQVSLTNLPTGSYDLQVPGSDAHHAFSIGTGDRSASFSLSVPTGTATGRVVDGSGDGVSGVQVGLADADGEFATTQTDAQGDYSFAITKAQSVDVVATGATVGVQIQSAVAMSATGATTVPTIHAGSASLDVTVTAGGNPVGGATVSVSTGSANDQPASVGATTSAAGTVSLGDLTPGSYHLDVADGTDATDVQTRASRRGDDLPQPSRWQRPPRSRES